MMTVTLEKQPALHKFELEFTGPSDDEEFRHWSYWLGFRIECWLAESERSDHYVNRYGIPGTKRVRVIVNDKDTALMLKLALA